MLSALPAFTKPVTIQGTASGGVPQVFISGTSATGGPTGLPFNSGSAGSSVQDLGIVGFASNYGIDIPVNNISVGGCWIGINSAGTADANQAGIIVDGSGATIGGTAASSANVLSGNSTEGIFLFGAALVEGNFIGTNAAGSAAVSNDQVGIVAEAPGVTIGGTAAGSGNVISGNSQLGLEVGASCLVEGNLIGTNAAGTAALSGQLEGIAVFSSGATIGGTAAGAGNVISGSVGAGSQVSAPSLIEGNLIGTDKTGTSAVPNLGGLIVNSPTATIGGTAAGAGNIIAFNGGYGVAIYPGTTGTTIRYNAIFSNGGAGIELAYPSLLPNTPDGANNTPIITSVGAGTITGTLNAAPNGTYILDFYANLASDDSASASQGRDYLTSTTVQTNAAGDAVFSVPFTPIPSLPIFTATATSAFGTTSQFSPPVGYGLTATGLTLTATTGVAFTGTVASFTSADPAANASQFTATINYGDGASSSPGTVIAAPGGFIVVGSHTYSTANPCAAVSVTITDNLGGSHTTASGLAQVAPLLTPVTRSPAFVAGTLYSQVVASFSDANLKAFAGQFTATINWGDGSASSAGVISADGAGFDVTGSHTYNFTTPSTVTEPVTVTITDTITGATATVNSTATINLTAKNFAVEGGVAFSGTIATFTDSDPRTNPGFYTATINWGDGTPYTAGTITGANPFTVTASHTFASFQNIDLVTVTITDKNGRTATVVDRVVDPPAVLDVQTSEIAVTANKPFVGTVATFTDTGPVEPASDYTATINWGKGRKTVGMVTGSNGQFIVTARHKFPKFSGTSLVKITVTDITDDQTVSVTETASYSAHVAKMASAKHADKSAGKRLR